MEEPEHFKKGTMSYRYPAISQIAVLAASLLILSVLIEILQAGRFIEPAIKTIGTVVLCICYVALMIWVFARPKGKQKLFITSVDALRGNFYERKIWPLIAGLYVGSFSLGAVVNGFLIIGIFFLVILLIVIIVSRFIKSGIRIDDSQNMYVLKSNSETLIRFEYASEIRCRYYSRLRKNFLRITFANNGLGELPSGLYINISKLHSEEFGTYLNPAVLSDFVKEKCSSLGFKIEEVGDQTIYNEWLARK